MKVLIVAKTRQGPGACIGGIGEDGQSVRLIAAETDWSVINLDKLTYAGNLENLASIEGNPRCRFVHADICDDAAVSAAARCSGCVSSIVGR